MPWSTRLARVTCACASVRPASNSPCAQSSTRSGSATSTSCASSTLPLPSTTLSRAWPVPVAVTEYESTPAGLVTWMTDGSEDFRFQPAAAVEG